jgi:hypothetical protein
MRLPHFFSVAVALLCTLSAAAPSSRPSTRQTLERRVPELTDEQITRFHDELTHLIEDGDDAFEPEEIGHLETARELLHARNGTFETRGMESLLNVFPDHAPTLDRRGKPRKGKKKKYKFFGEACDCNSNDDCILPGKRCGTDNCSRKPWFGDEGSGGCSYDWIWGND